MDDTLYYGALLCLLVGVLLGVARKLPGCEGDCEQGNKPCDCRK